MAKTRRFGRSPADRASMLRNLAISLIEHEKVRTTPAKASEVRRTVERLITLSSEDTTHHRKLVESRLNNYGAMVKLFEDLGPRFVARNGGYTRIYKLGTRKGDGAEMVQLELVE